MVDIFDEVEEELRAERAQRLLLRYGGVIVGAVVLVIVAVGGWQAWRWWQAKQDAAAAVSYVNAMAMADSASPTAIAARPATIGALDALAGAAPQGYRTLARLRAAALKAENGDMPGALKMWDEVAADGAADPLLRDLATLMWAQHQIDHGDPAQLAARLQALTSATNPWRALAREQLALLDLRQGKTDAAKTAFQQLADDVTAPAGVRGRSRSLASKLGG
ncbi:MAG: tetratricopeptide repeat protein [Rhodospirillales bacterium]|nr:tetratricopeptide repeat protein [Rhodospirillales bacterium]